MKKYVIFTLFLFLIPIFGYGATNAGFLSDNIWYSQDPFFAGNSVRIYSGIFNSSDVDIAGRVEFFDNGFSIGTADFSVEAGGNLVRVWTDWEANEGDHAILASIVEAKIITAGKEAAIDLSRSQTQEDFRYVDIDTDDDGTGDKEDQDDDNDGVVDEVELEIGTDSKDPNSKDAFNDLALAEPDADFDNDGITNEDEVIAGTDPYTHTEPEEYIDARQTPSYEDDFFAKIIKPLPLPVKKADEFVNKTFQEYIKSLEEKRQEVKGFRARQEVGIDLSQDENVPFRNNRFLQNAYVYFLTAISFALKIRLLVYILGIFLIYKSARFFIRRRRKE